jgi:hypothetical protein
MAKVESLINVVGSVGDLCFYKTKYGYMVRRKGGVSKEKIKYHRSYARTREHCADFGRAVHFSKLFRQAFGALIRRVHNQGVTGRLTSAMLQVIKADQVNLRGQRTAKNGQPELLEGFQINNKRGLHSVLLAPVNGSFDRASGDMTIEIPTARIFAPEAATHFCFLAGAAAIDFENNSYEAAVSESTYLSTTHKEAGPLKLIQKIKPGALGQLFLMLGIEFVKRENGRDMRLEGANANVLAVVKVER